MIEILIQGTILALVLAAGVRWAMNRFRDPLARFEPVSEEELRLLSVVDEDQYENLLKYVRTMIMPTQLQDYLSDKKDALESISYYMMLQVARREQEKKERWEKGRQDDTDRPLSHIEKKIIRGLKRF